jgi:microcystin-dependent protein
VCDGRSVLKTDFIDLYNIIGNSFGSVDSLHFNLPNMNGRVLGQIGQTSNVNDANHALGHSVGNENVTLRTTQIPSHSHTGTTNTSDTGITSGGTDGSHSHTINDSGHTHTFTANITDPSHSHTFTTNNTGGGLPFSVIQPTLFGGNLFIFATYEHQV